jgi:hypothetical protein
MVLRPGFEPGSPAFFLFNGERPEYLVHRWVFNLAILGRKGDFSLLLPELNRSIHANNLLFRFKFSMFD